PGITISGTGYVIEGAPTTIGINDSAYFWVRVSSAVAATPTGVVTINNDDATNEAYKLNLTSSIVACASAITTNEVYQDFDGNAQNSKLDYSNLNWSEITENPEVDD